MQDSQVREFNPDKTSENTTDLPVQNKTQIENFYSLNTNKHIFVACDTSRKKIDLEVSFWIGKKGYEVGDGMEDLFFFQKGPTSKVTDLLPNRHQPLLTMGKLWVAWNLDPSKYNFDYKQIVMRYDTFDDVFNSEESYRLYMGNAPENAIWCLTPDSNYKIDEEFIKKFMLDHSSSNAELEYLESDQDDFYISEAQSPVEETVSSQFSEKEVCRASVKRPRRILSDSSLYRRAAGLRF